MLVTRVERLEAVAPGENGRFRIFSFDVEATVAGPVDAGNGMVVNLADVKRTLRERLAEELQGRCLDGRDGAPDWRTPEALVRGIWELLGGQVAGIPLERIRLVGKPSPIVECTGGNGLVSVTRVYEFSASHRLHSGSLSEEENVRLFGKCNNPEGHGHNYVLEVTVRGNPGGSGELLDRAAFDDVVSSRVVDRWDHKFLNRDVEEFRDVNPTAEEIARVAWRRIREPLETAGGGSVKLHRIKVRETDRNHVEYFGEDEG